MEPFLSRGKAALYDFAAILSQKNMRRGCLTHLSDELQVPTGYLNVMHENYK